MEPMCAAVLHRLEELHAELDKALAGLPQEALDWSPGPEINSMTVLAVHVAGSERFWIGEGAGGEPANRVREQEFETARVDAATLQARLAETLAHSRAVLARLRAEDLARTSGTPRQGQPVTVAWALAHSLMHTAEHVGHMQLMRQLWDQRAGAAGPNS